MKLEHIALSINDIAEIKNFYFNILEMKELKNFVLDSILASNIFDIEKEATVFLLQKDELILEIFVTNEQIKQNFSHICIAVKNREELVKKAKLSGYKCIIIKRKIPDLIFIKDKSNNIFEIK